MRPAHHHWSGVRLDFLRRYEVAGHVSLSVLRLSRRGIRAVRHATVSLSRLDDQYPAFVYWAPLEHSANRRFLIVFRQRDESGSALARPPLLIQCEPNGEGLVYSEPEPEVAFPGALMVSPVTQCNLNCIHCVSRHSRERLSVLDEQSWREIAAAAGDGRVARVRSDYSGDLLFSDKRHGGWLDRFIALNIPLEIDTHANDLSADAIERLIASRLTVINFSIDSMDPEDYPRIRKGARPLEEVLENIRRFMAARNARRPDIQVLMSFVLMRRNLDTMTAAIDFAAKTGITLCGSHLRAYTADMAEESLMLEPARYETAYHALLAMARHKRVTLTLPPPIRSTVAAGRGHAPCRIPWQTAVVLGNGDVMACCEPGTRMGNLRDGSVAELWHGPDARQFRARVNSDHPPEPCSVCAMQRVENNFASYVPGLPEEARQDFERRCVRAARDWGSS